MKTYLKIWPCFLLIGATSCVTEAEQLSLDEVDTCGAALEQIKQTIEKNEGVTMEEIQTFDISEQYSGYPHPYFLAYVITLAGAGTEDVMTSSSLLKQISIGIMDKCAAASMVSIGESGTDYIRTFGFFENNNVSEFKCIDITETPDNTVPWGHKVCL